VLNMKNTPKGEALKINQLLRSQNKGRK
jgi:hypothetical protein